MEGDDQKRFPKGVAIYLFGATGDLSRRKLIPALYNLFERDILGEQTPIICIGRRHISNSEYIDHLDLSSSIPDSNKNILNRFIRQIHYFSVDLQSDEVAEFNRRRIELEKKSGVQGNRLFYLATSASLFEDVIALIKKTDLLEGEGFNRVVFEKPFGRDVASADHLNETISSVFKENEVYRIDHYLGKELVQNILVLRFANPFLNEVWNNHFIDHVQITVAEEIGVEERAEYYDNYGVLRDMVQNHLLQVLSLVAMDEPVSLKAEDIRQEKTTILKALKSPDPDDVILGQYGRGSVQSREVPGYRSEAKVVENSRTETFAALKVDIPTERWEGVPFYLRTGKRLASTYSEVSLVLKTRGCHLFNHDGRHPAPNVITVRVKPDEGIIINLNGKEPGANLQIHPITLSFCHYCQFGTNSAEAYEMLLQQVLLGDQTLFISWPEIRESWKIIDTVRATTENKRNVFPNYRAGSMGPELSDTLLIREGRAWIIPASRPYTGVNDEYCDH